RRLELRDSNYLRFALVAGFLVAGVFVAALRPAAGLVTGRFPSLRACGRLCKAARCAAASAPLAQLASSSESSNRRAGNCQYEFTVTVLVRVWYWNGADPSASHCGVVFAVCR